MGSFEGLLLLIEMLEVLPEMIHLHFMHLPFSSTHCRLSLLKVFIKSQIVICYLSIDFGSVISVVKFLWLVFNIAVRS